MSSPARALFGVISDPAEPEEATVPWPATLLTFPTALIVVNAMTITGAVTLGGSVSVSMDAGSAAVPTLHFGASVFADSNTGIFQPADNQLGISCGGTLRATFNSSGATLPGSIILNNGSTNGIVTVGPLADDPTNYGGIWFVASPNSTNYSFLGSNGDAFVNSATTLSLRVANTDVATITSSGLTMANATAIRLLAGTAGTPAINFGAASSDTNTGFYQVAGDQIGVSAGGTLRATFSTTALVLGAAVSLETNGLKAAITTKTGTYTATAADHTILCDATGGAFDIDLPAAASHAGRIFVIKKIDATANQVSVDPNGTELIDGASTSFPIANQFMSIAIQSDGTSWHVIAVYLT